MTPDPTDDPFGEYIRHGEPNQYERAVAWKTGIGLQAVDGLTVSDYLLDVARQSVEGHISYAEVDRLITSYYDQRVDAASRDQEADTVAARTSAILTENSFVLSPQHFYALHRRLFEGILPEAGSLRTFDISKKE